MNSNNYQVCGFVIQLAGCVFKIKSVQDPATLLETIELTCLCTVNASDPLAKICQTPLRTTQNHCSKHEFPKDLRLIYQEHGSQQKNVSVPGQVAYVWRLTFHKSLHAGHLPRIGRSLSKGLQTWKMWCCSGWFAKFCWRNPKANHEALKLWTMRKAGNLASMSHNWKYMSKSNPTVCKRGNGAMPCWENLELTVWELDQGWVSRHCQTVVSECTCQCPRFRGAKGRWHGTIWHVCW